MSKGGGGGGGTQVLNGYPCQTPVQRGSDERQNLGKVNSFWDRKGGSQLYIKNIIGEVNDKRCLFHHIL